MLLVSITFSTFLKTLIKLQYSAESPAKIGILRVAVRSTQRWLLVVKEGLVDPLRRAPVRFIARLIGNRVPSFLPFGGVWI